MDETMTQALQEFLSLKEFVDLTGLSESTIRRRVKDGSLPVHQPGGKGKKMVFPRNALEYSQGGQGGKQSSPATAEDAQVPAASEAVPIAARQEPSKPTKISGPQPKWRRSKFPYAPQTSS